MNQVKAQRSQFMTSYHVAVKSITTSLLSPLTRSSNSAFVLRYFMMYLLLCFVYGKQITVLLFCVSKRALCCLQEFHKSINSRFQGFQRFNEHNRSPMKIPLFFIRAKESLKFKWEKSSYTLLYCTAYAIENATAQNIYTLVHDVKITEKIIQLGLFFMRIQIFVPALESLTCHQAAFLSKYL